MKRRHVSSGYGILNILYSILTKSLGPQNIHIGSILGKDLVIHPESSVKLTLLSEFIGSVKKIYILAGTAAHNIGGTTILTCTYGISNFQSCSATLTI